MSDNITIITVNECTISSPVGNLCHTPGVVCGSLAVMCRLCPPYLPEIN